MKKLSVNRFLVFAGFLAFSTMLMQFVWLNFEQKSTFISDEKINLALRRAADALLKESGDSTTRIPAVVHRTTNMWSVRIERNFKYHNLPKILQSSFDVFGKVHNYNVVIKHCNDDNILLGYNYADFLKNNNVACQDREFSPDCYDLQINFTPKQQNKTNMPVLGWILSGVLALSLFGLGKYKFQKHQDSETLIKKEANCLDFGKSSLDVSNQMLKSGGITNKLTYRESKLLHLFVTHPNQILERNFILDNVWKDEGILVGRSLDMFVSRLRKMLREDHTIKLTAIHGVGYKLEVS
ncbi:MAG: winged helix-turn-helix transcriptional regulator [Saprospiraceae bacterium]|nr:winged helix-turn-helix transcriptional regulator [Saprospiraceae bacterium]